MAGAANNQSESTPAIPAGMARTALFVQRLIRPAAWAASIARQGQPLLARAIYRRFAELPRTGLWAQRFAERFVPGALRYPSGDMTLVARVEQLPEPEAPSLRWGRSSAAPAAPLARAFDPPLVETLPFRQAAEEPPAADSAGAGALPLLSPTQPAPQRAATPAQATPARSSIQRHPSRHSAVLLPALPAPDAQTLASPTIQIAAVAPLAASISQPLQRMGIADSAAPAGAEGPAATTLDGESTIGPAPIIAASGAGLPAALDRDLPLVTPRTSGQPLARATVVRRLSRLAQPPQPGAAPQPAARPSSQSAGPIARASDSSVVWSGQGSQAPAMPPASAAGQSWQASASVAAGASGAAEDPRVLPAVSPAPLRSLTRLSSALLQRYAGPTGSSERAGSPARQAASGPGLIAPFSPLSMTSPGQTAGRSTLQRHTEPGAPAPASLVPGSRLGLTGRAGFRDDLGAQRLPALEGELPLLQRLPAAIDSAQPAPEGRRAGLAGSDPAAARSAGVIPGLIARLALPPAAPGAGLEPAAPPMATRDPWLLQHSPLSSATPAELSPLAGALDAPPAGGSQGGLAGGAILGAPPALSASLRPALLQRSQSAAAGLAPAIMSRIALAESSEPGLAAQPHETPSAWRSGELPLLQRLPAPDAAGRSEVQPAQTWRASHASAPAVAHSTSSAIHGAPMRWPVAQAGPISAIQRSLATAAAGLTPGLIARLSLGVGTAPARRRDEGQGPVLRTTAPLASGASSGLGGLISPPQGPELRPAQTTGRIDGELPLLQRLPAQAGARRALPAQARPLASRLAQPGSAAPATSAALATAPSTPAAILGQPAMLPTSAGTPLGLIQRSQLSMASQAQPDRPWPAGSGSAADAFAPALSLASIQRAASPLASGLNAQLTAATGSLERPGVVEALPLLQPAQAGVQPGQPGTQTLQRAADARRWPSGPAILGLAAPAPGLASSIPLPLLQRYTQPDMGSATASSAPEQSSVAHLQPLLIARLATPPGGAPAVTQTAGPAGEPGGSADLALLQPTHAAGRELVPGLIARLAAQPAAALIQRQPLSGAPGLGALPLLDTAPRPQHTPERTRVDRRASSAVPATPAISAAQPALGSQAMLGAPGSGLGARTAQPALGSQAIFGAPGPGLGALAAEPLPLLQRSPAFSLDPSSPELASARSGTQGTHAGYSPAYASQQGGFGAQTLPLQRAWASPGESGLRALTLASTLEARLQPGSRTPTLQRSLADTPGIQAQRSAASLELLSSARQAQGLLDFEQPLTSGLPLVAPPSGEGSTATSAATGALQRLADMPGAGTNLTLNAPGQLYQQASAPLDLLEPMRTPPEMAPLIQRAEGETPASPGDTGASDAGAPDIEALAREVYARIRRKLSIEAERLGR